MSKHPILFVLSIDTEEEWDWSGPFPSKEQQVGNIKLLAPFQKLCDKLHIRPTYFVDYAVADDKESTAVLTKIFEQDNVEMGAHLHPWANPPSLPEVNERNSHVVNLPIEIVESQLINLNKLLKSKFDNTPVSFRTGRWGINGSVLKLLHKQGYRIDSSVYPFYKNDFFSCLGAPTKPYWPDWENPLVTSAQKSIAEIPVTAGFNKQDFNKAEIWHQRLSSPPFSYMRGVGVAWHTKLLRKIYLSPELHTLKDMLTLSEIVIDKGASLLHMFMHSSSLIDNPNSLVGNQDAYGYITGVLQAYIRELQQHYNLEFCTISEAVDKLKQRGKL